MHDLVALHSGSSRALPCKFLLSLQATCAERGGLSNCNPETALGWELGTWVS